MCRLTPARHLNYPAPKRAVCWVIPDKYGGADGQASDAWLSVLDLINIWGWEAAVVVRKPQSNTSKLAGARRFTPSSSLPSSQPPHRLCRANAPQLGFTTPNVFGLHLVTLHLSNGGSVNDRFVILSFSATFYVRRSVHAKVPPGSTDLQSLSTTHRELIHGLYRLFENFTSTDHSPSKWSPSFPCPPPPLVLHHRRRGLGGSSSL